MEVKKSVGQWGDGRCDVNASSGSAPKAGLDPEMKRLRFIRSN